MDYTRFAEIWQAVVVNKFYTVGPDAIITKSDISHEEFAELLQMAKDAMEGNGKKHLRVWWREGLGRSSGVVIESRYIKGDAKLCVKVDNTHEIKFIDRTKIDSSEWVDDPSKGYIA